MKLIGLEKKRFLKTRTMYKVIFVQVSLNYRTYPGLRLEAHDGLNGEAQLGFLGGQRGLAEAGGDDAGGRGRETVHGRLERRH